MEQNIIIEYETIKMHEQRQLIETARDLSKILTREEYLKILFIYQDAIDRIEKLAEKQGIKL